VFGERGSVCVQGLGWRSFRSKSGATADRFNNVATGYRGTALFRTRDAGTGVALPADHTFVAGDGGTHTFAGAVTLVTAGAKSVTATDASGGSVTGSITVAVSAAAATHFAVTVPATATAGLAFSVMVTALDRFNNVASGDSVTVHFTTVDPGAGATLPADYTFIASDNGVHTLVNGVRLVTPEDQVIVATDTSSGPITVISQPIAVQRPISR
jgi:hypothetical protein